MKTMLIASSLVREARAYLAMMARQAPPRSLPYLVIDNERMRS